ncbi:hypothetical protein L0Z11_04575 [Burkholderia multivorans]|uniref:hypothetical protein n=1 Tax=Burkholderia multivorans TaxID=87883 RepID=UPI00123AFACC|nr:hypothetical protein [Burkholderia multivorans]QET31270.1 hypothetical protein FOB31_16330 [Burkholderia multivorans]QET41312.1 hypothetical protein FOB30_27540 [Burkholderia multivorans]UQN70183.1 hypothetical protein L0Z45_04595 [Burkholderia multivorans]UQN75912.1 hypothetical protein L0Z11_04575 [Burkholderia multivorans]
MQSMMQVLSDIQVEGRFFPRGSRVQVIEAGDSSLVLPDPDAHTTLCAVPTKNLARLTLFRVVLVNHRVGLMDEQERWGLDADDVRSSIARSAPDCEILELNEASL